MGYSNSSLVTYTKLSPNNSGNKTQPISIFTPHCIVGQWSVETAGNYFARPATDASANYVIGKDGRIGLVVPESKIAWTSSSKDNDSKAVTVECASDTYHPYKFTDACYQSLIKLCVDVCKRNGKNKLVWLNDKNKTLAYKPKSNEMLLTLHRYYKVKACPGDWLVNKLDNFTAEVNKQLSTPIQPKDDTPTQEEFERMFKVAMSVYLKQLSAQDESSWSKDEGYWKQAQNKIGVNGKQIVDGTNPLGNITREQMAAILGRLGLLD